MRKLCQEPLEDGCSRHFLRDTTVTSIVHNVIKYQRLSLKEVQIKITKDTSE